MSGLALMAQMDSAERRIDLAVKAGNRTGFEAGAANYAQASWNKTVRLSYDQVNTLMASYKADKDKFWGDLYRVVFGKDTG